MTYKSKIFLDSSAFIALYAKDDEFHKKAINLLAKLKKNKSSFVTTNFILDEVYTFLRARKNKKTAVDFSKLLSESTSIIKIIRITVVDEKKAFQFFKKINGRGVSFTDCTSFALMKRLGLTLVFTFDNDFSKAGFDLIS